MEDPVAALFIAILAASAGYFGVTRSSLDGGLQAPFMLILCGIAIFGAAVWITVTLSDPRAEFAGWFAVVLSALVMFGGILVIHRRIQERSNKK